MRIHHLIGISVALTAPEALAVDIDASHCAELLRQGVYDYYYERNSTVNEADVRKAFLNANSQEKTDNYGGGADVNYGLLSFGGTMSAAERESSAALFQQSNSEVVKNKGDYLRDVRKINAHALTAFNQCIQLSQTGVQVESDISPERLVASFTVRQASRGTVSRLQRLQMLPVGAFECRGSLAENAEGGVDITTNALNMTCDRRHSKDAQGFVTAPAATIVIDTDQGSFKKYVPAITPPRSNMSSELPIGAIVPFSGLAAPKGWIACDGRTLNPLEYPELAAVFGATKDFTVPDLRGRFIRGLNLGETGAGRDPDDRKLVGVAQAAATAQPVSPYEISSAGAHEHGYSDAWFAEVDCGNSGLLGSNASDRDNGYCMRSATTSNTGAHQHALTGGDKETRPVNVSVNFIIHVGIQRPVAPRR